MQPQSKGEEVHRALRSRYDTFFYIETQIDRLTPLTHTGLVMTQQAFINKEHSIAKTRRRWLHARWEAKKTSNGARLELVRVIDCKFVPVKPAIDGLHNEAKAMLAELETKEGFSLEVSQRARQGTFTMAGYELEASGIWSKASNKLEATEGEGKVEVEDEDEEEEEHVDRKNMVEREELEEDAEGPVPITPRQEIEELDNIE